MQKKLKNYEVKVFLQYTGSQSETGMVVMEVEMVSGLVSNQTLLFSLLFL